MTLAMYSRPRTTAWAHLSRSRMTKQAAGPLGWIGPAFNASKRYLWNNPLLTTPANWGITGGVAKLPAVKWMAAHPPTPKQLGGAGVGAGVTVAGTKGLTLLHYNALQRESDRVGAQAAEQAAAAAKAQQAAAEAAAKAKQPDAIESAFGGVGNYAKENWPWLVPAGIGVGGAGLLWKRHQDRKREREEEELLSGMHPKIAMVKLTQEFPIQMGFLARCGERQLNSSQVQMAIEKCASISDGMAEDWIRFFDAAARFETGTSPGMVKVAVPIKPLPPKGTVAPEPPVAAVTKPVPPPPPPAPKASMGDVLGNTPLGMVGRGLSSAYNTLKPTAIAENLRGVSTGGGLAQSTVPGMVGRGVSSVYNAVKPTAVAEGIRTFSGEGGGAPAPESAPTPTAATVPGQPLTNTQTLAKNAPTVASRAQYQNYMRNMFEFDRRANDPALPPAQRAQAQEQARQLRLNLPKSQAAATGPEAATQPLLTHGQQLAQQELARRGEQGVTSSVRDVWNAASRNRWIPTVEGVERDAKDYAAKVRAGVDPELAAKEDWSAAGNDSTPGAAYVNYLKGMTGVLPAIYAGVPGGIVSDALHLDPKMTNTAAAARDLTAPLTEAMGPYHNEARQTSGLSMQRSVMPQLSNTLRDFAEAKDPTLGGVHVPFSQYAAGLGSRLAGDYTMLGNLAPVGGLLGAASRGYAPAKGLFSGGLRNLGSRAMGGVMGLPVSSEALMEWPNQTADDTGLSPRQQQGQQRNMLEASAGMKPFTPDQLPTGMLPDQQKDWAASTIQGGIAAQNASREQAGRPPMNQQEVAAFTEKQQAQFKPLFRQQNEARIAANITGMSKDGGRTMDPYGVPQLPKDFNPANTRSFMTDEMTQHMSVMHQHDKQTFDDLVAKLPNDMQQHLQTGAAPTAQELEAMKAAGVDINAVKASAYRLAFSGPLINSTLPEFNGDLRKAQQAYGTPEAMMAAAGKDEALAAAAKTKVADGSAPSFFEGLKQTWDGLGSMGQMLVGGGMALGLFGLISSFMGEGGMGSILMTLLGGGAAALGLNQAGMLPTGASDILNQGLDMFGLKGMLGSPQPAAAGAVAGATAPATGPGGEPLAAPPPAGGTVPGTAPGAAPGAADKLGILMKDPAAKQALLNAPPEQQKAQFKEMLTTITPAQKEQLDGTYAQWAQGGTSRWAANQMVAWKFGIPSDKAGQLLAMYGQIQSGA